MSNGQSRDNIRWSQKIRTRLQPYFASPREVTIYLIFPIVAGLLLIIAKPWDTPPDPPLGCSQFETPRLTDRFRYWRASRNTVSGQREFMRDELFVDGNPRKAGDVLIRTSEQLSELADSIRDHELFVEGRPRLIFLYGSAGSGKSAVVDVLQEISGVAFFNVGGFFRYESGRQHPDTTMESQLVYNGTVISTMPQLRDSVLGMDTHFVDFFERYIGSTDDDAPSSISPREAVTTIIDGLDEIHPVSATRLIEAAWRFLGESARVGEPKNIVLSGRGEAFRDFFEKDENNQLKFEAVYVKPLYVYHEPLLSWHAADWEWWKSEREGDAPGVARITDNITGVRELMRAHGDVKNFMFTLYPANLVYENIGYQEQSDIIGLLFDRLVRRNAQRHYRPASPNSGRAGYLYTAALVQLARMALKEIDENGTFVLAGNSLLCIGDQEPIYITASETLNYSGIIDLYPFERTHLEYRWFPLPLLKYLAEGRVHGQTF